MKHTIEGLIELALNDSDQWVRLIANILKPYPMTYRLSLDLRSNEIAANVLERLDEKGSRYLLAFSDFFILKTVK